MNNNFHGHSGINWLQFSPIRLRTGTEAPVLKKALRGILQLWSVSHHFLRLKLHKSRKFHAGIIFCTIDA